MVSPDDIRTVVGAIGNAISMGLFLSTVPTFYKIWKKKSVEQYSPVPYLATLLNCMLWVLYGLPIVHPNSLLVITINGAGIVIMLNYIAIFLIYSTGGARLRVLSILAAEVAFIVVTGVLVILLAHTHTRRSLIVGVMCIIFGTMIYVAPLSIMKLVIQTKSVEYMPLPLSVVSLLNGICWTTYALIRFDLFITIPNGLGVMFSLAQLTLYAVYYKSTKRQLEARRRKGVVGMSEVVVVADNTTDPNRGASQNDVQS